MFDFLNFFIALVALAISIVAVYFTHRTRQADSFAKLYDELNTPSFGANMERIGEWTMALSTQIKKEDRELTESDIRISYRDHLERLITEGENTKDDPMERARRTVKAWFIKCLLYYEGYDLSAAHLQALITLDRALLMRRVFAITREQTDVWKRLPHDPTSRNSSDEQYFVRLERIAAGKRDLISSCRITRVFSGSRRPCAR